MTTGLTINQGADVDNEILALKSTTDVAHGVTGLTETDTFGLFKKFKGDSGGLEIIGLDDAGDTGLVLNGVAVTDHTDKDAGARGYIILRARKKNGVNVAVAGSDAALVTIDSEGTTRFIFDAEGSGHAEVEWVAFDDYDDLALISEIESELLKVESSAGTANRHMLEKTGIIGKDSWHMENGRPRAMVNMTRLSMLHHGALMQAADKIKTLESRLLAIEGAK